MGEKRSDDAPLIRRAIAAELKKMREATGFGVSEVASLIGMGRDAIYKIERAATIPHQPTLERLCQIYGASEEATAHLVGLRNDSKEVGRWESHGPGADGEWALYTAALRDAKALRVFEPEMLPGLLQLVPSYIEKLQSAQRIPAGHATAIRKLRLSQQQDVFRRTRRRTMRFVLGVGVLRYLDRHPELQQAQVEHILSLVASHGIEVRVLDDFHMCMFGPYHIVTPGLSGLAGPTFVYAESFDGSRYIEDSKVVAQYEAAHAELFHIAKPIEEWV